ncbi:MAG TPA: POTRA domain-containing protein [Burkholderiales bacterium]|nr:POTRA domain-containing protein [Burkholderiales bacterium]
MGIAPKLAWIVLAVVTASAASAFAQMPPSRDDTRTAPMDISGYAIEGRILLEPGDFSRIVAPYVGRRKTTADVERARTALTRAYHDLGHCSVKVTLAQPEPRDGVMTFRVAEVPAGEIRDCLPMIALNEQAAPIVPAAVIAQSGSVKTTPAIPSAEPSGPVAAGTAEIVPVAPAVSPKFEIRRYLTEGNTLLAQEEVDRVLAPFVGQDKDFGDVQKALEALQTSYQAAGYGSVEVRLPEQELERGEVRFNVIEVKVGKITIEGNEHFTAQNIRRSVPSLREGTTPNTKEIGESMRLANENPSKQSAVLLRGAEREGVVDATIRVADVNPQRWSASFDNTGNSSTGQTRLGIAYQHSNLFDLDHILTTQYITSPADFKNVNVYGIGYKIPLYANGDSIDFVAGYSNVDSGTVQGLFLVSGKGAIYGARYNQALPKWGDLEHKLVYGLDYRAYQNKVTQTSSSDPLVPDITVHPVSLTYSASARGTGQDLSFYTNVARNIAGGSDGQDDDFQKPGARPGGKADYLLYRAGFNYVRVVGGDWQLRANFSAQYTDDALVAPEQFGIGGADSVRGFNERYVSNDKGHRASLEIYTPDWSKSMGLEDGRLRYLAFYDTGGLHRNYPLATEQAATHLDSAGLGLRMNYKNYFTARLDVAIVLHDGSGFNPPDSRRNSKKAHFSAAWVW